MTVQLRDEAPAAAPQAAWVRPTLYALAVLAATVIFPPLGAVVSFGIAVLARRSPRAMRIVFVVVGVLLAFLSTLYITV